MSKSKCALVALSNPLSVNFKDKISELITFLNEIFTGVVVSDFIFENVICSEKDKTNELNSILKTQEISVVFDVSGGDLANGTLEYIDYNLIKDSNKMFFGYSDLTCVLNAVYAKAGVKTYLYQVKNVLCDNSMTRCKNLSDFIYGKNSTICDFGYDFIQGNCMQGIAVGGNIRCFSKLIGTEYMPCCEDKIVFLESYSGGLEKIYSLVFQLKQSGAFNRCNGILLGTFTEIEKKNLKTELFEMLKNILPNIPIAYTSEIGHSENSKCFVIGQNYLLKK